MNITKLIIYIYEFDLEDVNILKEGLTIFGVTNVEEATWSLGFALVVWGIRIQPTFALVRVVKGD